LRLKDIVYCEVLDEGEPLTKARLRLATAVNLSLTVSYGLEAEGAISRPTVRWTDEKRRWGVAAHFHLLQRAGGAFSLSRTGPRRPPLCRRHFRNVCRLFGDPALQRAADLGNHAANFATVRISHRGAGSATAQSRRR